MAKISRRAVAASSPSSSFSSASYAASVGPSAVLTNSLTGLTAPNVNNIVTATKTTRVSSLENSSKYLELNNVNNDSGIRSDALHDINTPSSSYAHSTTEETVRTSQTPYTPYIHRNGGAATPTFTTPHLQNETLQAQILAAAERERIRAEFFATYDVMTGVRIAATLGGFFGLMVFLIVWKSRSSSNETLKVLKDPKMAAVAAVCMQEEEEREIQEAMVATGMSIYPDEYDAIIYRRQRMLSLGNVSAPPMLNRGFRFSSVGGGGYSSLLEPPRRFSYSAVSGAGSITGGRRKSGSESSRVLSNYPMGNSFGTDDYFIETEDEMEDGDYARSGKDLDELRATHKRTDSKKSNNQGFLEVPLMGHDSRRSSAMTCCSTESSYLERRCSAFTLGLGNLPPSLQRKLSTASRTSSTDNWDYYYPDIQVIQPTPKPSPCPSERSIYEQLQAQNKSVAKTTASGAAATVTATVTAASTTKTARVNQSAKNGNLSQHIGGIATINTAPTFVRKHSIAYYDPESAQGGRKQQIHSISADTVDMYPYNQTPLGADSMDLIRGAGIGGGAIGDFSKGIQSAPPVAVHHGFHFTDSPTEELRLSMRRKIAVMELQRTPHTDQPAPVSSGNGNGNGAGIALIATAAPGTTFENNNNSFPYANSAAAIAAAAAVAAAAAAAANSSSISIDSTPLSIDKLNGSGSLGTVSAKALFNVERRAPLASLSSFKISSVELPDSEMRSMDDDSVFVDSVADTDEDMQQLSSDSEEASLEEQHESAALSRENTALVAPSAQDTASHRQPVEKRYSLGATASAIATAAATTLTTSVHTNVGGLRRSLLQRNRTISVSSSDRVSLLSQQMKEFPVNEQFLSVGTGHGVPLETHFGSLICTDSPPAHPRRAQLLQQYSDPQSLPTTTTTTTTTTTEDDTCSTLNTELCGAGGSDGIGSGEGVTYGSGTGAGGSGAGTGGESTTHTQYSSMNTVVSIGRSSSSPHADSSRLSSPAANANEINLMSQSKQLQQQQQLPRSTKLLDDPCASSISDTAAVIGQTPRQPIICMPSSLKNLILRGSSSSDKIVLTSPNTASRSATNLSLLDRDGGANNIGGPSVTLELPLIKLPTDESTDSSTTSDNDEHAHSKSDASRDPSLPGTSRKWSKETLF